MERTAESKKANRILNGREYSRVAAAFLSVIFSPPLVVCCVLVLLYEQFGFRLSSVIAVFFVLGPVAYVLFLLKKGAVSGFHMTAGSERLGPVKLTVLSVTAGVALLIYLGAPAAVIDFGLACLVAVSAFCAVTFYYKVSAHSATFAAFCAMITFFHRHEAGAALVVLLPLVSWARVRLDKHTAMQTLVGCLLGWLVIFAVLKIRGY